VDPVSNRFGVFRKGASDTEIQDYFEKGADKVPLYFTKQAESRLLRLLGAVTGLNDDLFQGKYWPSPAAHTLAGGLLGAGLGYGAGALTDWMFPSEWDGKKRRRNWALLGGLAGASPGMLMSLASLAGGSNPLKNDFTKSLPLPQRLDGPLTNASEQAGKEKDAAFSAEQFVWTTNHDPFLAEREKLLANAAVGAAAFQNRSDKITSVDMARLAGGMGAGYLTGAMVGKAMGALLGVPPQEQQRIRETGLWAGAVNGMLSKLF
jgi:hypothetical protein